MALIVRIYVNDKLIEARWCRRLTNLEEGQESYMYETDDGRVFYHKYKEGARKLARRLLSKDLTSPQG